MSSGGQGNSRGTGALQSVAHTCAPLAISEGRLLPVGMLVPRITKGVGWCSRVKRGNNTTLTQQKLLTMVVMHACAQLSVLYEGSG